MEHQDVVVIGGGLAGLTAATLLGQEGLRVTVFERGPALGGRAATRDRSGFSFNLGPHALYSGGATSRTLERLGIHYAKHPTKPPLVLREGQIQSLIPNPISLLRGAPFTAAEWLELTNFFVGVARLNPRSVARSSVRTFIDERLRRPRARQLVDAFARTFVYSSALDLASAEVFADKLKRQLTNPVHYLDGGWGVLVDALRRTAEIAGVEIRTGVSVESLVTRGGKAEGVRLRGGTTMSANAVVIATTPREAGKLLEGVSGSKFEEALSQLVPVQVACLDVSLSILPNLRNGIVQDLEQPRFMSVQSLVARVAPAGAGFITSFKQLDPRVKSDPKQDERDLESLLDVAQPGWRSVMLERVFLPRIEAVGALPTAATDGFAGRPGVNATGVAGVYLAGDWVGSEGFLADASFASASLAVERILEDRRVRTEPPVVQMAR